MILDNPNAERTVNQQLLRELVRKHGGASLVAVNTGYTQETVGRHMRGEVPDWRGMILYKHVLGAEISNLFPVVQQDAA